MPVKQHDLWDVLDFTRHQGIHFQYIAESGYLTIIPEIFITVISLFEAASIFKVAPPTLMSGLPQIKHQ